MCPITKEGLQRLILDAAVQLRQNAGSLRAEGMSYLIAAREFLRLNQLDGAEIAVKNALSVLMPLWNVERHVSSRR